MMVQQESNITSNTTSDMSSENSLVCETANEDKFDLLENYDITIPNDFHNQVKSIVRDDSVDFLLKCIPNSDKGQHKNVWLGVGMAVHRTSSESTSETLKAVAFTLFDRWSASSKKYNKQTTKHAWYSFSKCYRQIGYNKATLFRLARQAYPQCFKADFAPFLHLKNYEDFIVHYNEPFVQPYDNYTTLFEMSAMGTGKTYQLAKTISTLNPKRVICLSPKQTFATNFCADLNNALGYNKDDQKAFVNYLDLVKQRNNEEWHTVDRIVIQMESLFKIDLTCFQRYDLLIADECESLLKCFSSPTMDNGICATSTSNRLLLVIETFAKVIKSSTRCIFADAFLSNRTLDVINSIRPFTPSSTRININDYIPQNRIAVKFKTFNKFKTKVIESLQQGKRIVVFWSSKKKGQEFEALIQANLPHVRIKFYHSGSDDTMEDDLQLVNDVWTKDVDLLMYTAKITVGVNYTVKNQFDDIFVYGYAGGPCARDVCQSILRVRFSKSNTLHYFLDGRAQTHKEGTTYGAVENRIEWKYQQLKLQQTQILNQLFHANDLLLKDDILQNVSKDIIDNTWTKHLHILNTLEDNLSNNFFHAMFEMYLKASGFELSHSEETREDDSDIDWRGTKYVDVPTCNLNQIAKVICSKSATMMDKLMYRKAKFDYFLDMNIPLDVNTVQKLWERSDAITILKHHYILKHKIVDVYTDVLVFTSSQSLMIKQLFELCEIMGISDVMTKTVIELSSFNKGLEYVKKNLNEIVKTFQCEDIGADKRTDKKVMKILKMIFSKTCYGHISTKSKVAKIKVDGERKSKRIALHYVLTNSINKKYKCDLKSMIR